jgi:hypothetical protein
MKYGVDLEEYWRVEIYARSCGLELNERICE